MERNILEVNEVHAFYGQVHALWGLSLTVKERELVYLVGRNGVGKSTTLKTVTGIVSVRSGSIMLDGREIAGLPPHQIAGLGTGYVPGDKRVFSGLTVRQNLESFQRKSEGGKGWTIERVYELFPVLRRLQGNRAEILSGGEQEMLVVGRALMRNPRLLLIDEPFEGLAPLVVRQLENVIDRLKGDISIVMVEVNLKRVVRLADRVYTMDRGRIVSEQTGEKF